MNNAISEIKNTLEATNSRITEADTDNREKHRSGTLVNPTNTLLLTGLVSFFQMFF